jgi:hypothetical protein
MPIKKAYYVRVFCERTRVCENVKRRRERGTAAICSRVCELRVE